MVCLFSFDAIYTVVDCFELIECDKDDETLLNDAVLKASVLWTPFNKQSCHDLMEYLSNDMISIM